MQVGNGSVNGVGEDSICILHCCDSWRPLIILCEHYVHSSVCLLMKTVWVGFIHKCTGVKKWAAWLHDYPPPPYGKRTHTKLTSLIQNTAPASYYDWQTTRFSLHLFLMQKHAAHPWPPTMGPRPRYRVPPCSPAFPSRCHCTSGSCLNMTVILIHCWKHL